VKTNRQFHQRFTRVFFVQNFGAKNNKAARSTFVQNFGPKNVVSHEKHVHKMLMKLTPNREKKCGKWG